MTPTYDIMKLGDHRDEEQRIWRQTGWLEIQPHSTNCEFLNLLDALVCPKVKWVY
jgi:hypothetical protein